MKTETALVLVGHGSPPNDFPKRKLQRFFSLSSKRKRDKLPEDELREYHDLESEMREWPRTRENDPYWAGVADLASKIEKKAGVDVFEAFGEFCAPTTVEAIIAAIDKGHTTVVITSTMMTRGGKHSEEEIAEEVSAAKQDHPDVDIYYAWPYDQDRLAEYIAQHVETFVP